MTRRVQRASQATVDAVHNLVGRELARQLKESRKEGKPVSAALLTAALGYLKLTDTRDPAQPKHKKDTLAAVMPDFDALEAGMRPPKDS